MSMYLLDVGVLFLTVGSYCIIFSQELKKQWYPDTVLKQFRLIRNVEIFVKSVSLLLFLT